MNNPTNTTPVIDLDKLRTEFEAAMGKLDLPRDAFDKWPDGRYLQEPIESYWSGFQLARQQTPVTGKVTQHVKTYSERETEWKAANAVGVVPTQRMLREEVAELRAALATHQATLAAPADEQQSEFAPPFAAPAGIDKDAWADMVGEVAELYGRLLAEKSAVHIIQGRDRGMEYYIADAIRWAVAELQRRCRAQGGATKATDPASPPKPAASQQAGVAFSAKELIGQYRMGYRHGYAEGHAAQASHAGAVSEQDSARLDWLNQNFFSDQKDQWDERLAPDSIKWKFFGPMSVQGDIHRVIDAAIATTEQQEKVAPPPRGTGSQHEADEREFFEHWDKVNADYGYGETHIIAYKAAQSAWKAARLCRAQRTNNDNKE